MSKYFMGVDAGTHGVRVGITDDQGQFIAMHEVEHPTEYPVPGRAEQNAEHWWVGLKEALRDCLNEITEEQRKNIVSGCVCATSSTVVPVNEDIGRVKIPRMLKQRYSITNIDFVNGNDFPDDLTKYDLIIICGGCMFNRRHIMSRVEQAKKQNVPMTNYGILLAYVNDILDKIVYVK